MLFAMHISDVMVPIKEASADTSVYYDCIGQGMFQCENLFLLLIYNVICQYAANKKNFNRRKSKTGKCGSFFL